MQFNLQVNVEVYQDVTWENNAPGYQYEITIEGLKEPVAVKGGINQDGGLAANAANHNLIKEVLKPIESAINAAIANKSR